MTRPESAEVDRIRDVYRERDQGPARHPAIRDAYQRLNADRLARMETLVRPVAPPGRGRLLDVGCGAGLDLAHWIAAGWAPDRLAGTDLVADRIERARRISPDLDLRLTDGAILPFPDDAFDVATAVTVFSSILDPRLRAELFREMTRVVRPGGLVIVYDFVVRKPTNPNVRGLGLSALRRLAGRSPDGSIRLTPLLQAVAAGAMLGRPIAGLAMRLAPRTHRLSFWTVPEATVRHAASQATASHLNATADSGTRLLVVTSLYPTPDRPAAGAFVARRVGALQERGVNVAVVAARSYQRPAWVRLLSLLAGAIGPQGQVDGVEGHVLFPTGVVAILAGRLRRVPVVIYAHGSDVMATARRNRATLALARWVARSADRVVTNSEATAAWVALLGASARVISPGVDLRHFQPGAQAAARERLGLDVDGLLALFVGEVAELKGADLFATAVAVAPGWHGLIVGRGQLAPEIAARYPMIRQAGAVRPEHIPDWMRAADVVVVPSRREGLGLAAIEALACGRPVIAAATGGLPEVVLDRANGLLVTPGDAAALIDALGQLRDPELRNRLGGAAPASVTRFDIDGAAHLMAEVWAELGVQA